MSEGAFERYVAPARQNSESWIIRTLVALVPILVGLLAILIGWLVWTALVMGGAVGLELYRGHAWAEAVDLLRQRFTSDHPGAIALMLATFLGIWPATWAAVRWLHRRSFWTLLSPEGRMRWGELGAGLGLALLVWVVGILVALLLVGPPARSSVSVGVWAGWLVPLALLVFAQASGEELIFRGYLLQQLAARWRSALVWGFLPAFLFGIAHLDPTRDATMNFVYVSTTAVFGVIAALLVWRTGSLAAAMGLHAGNNFGAICLTGLEGVASGSQLWVYDEAVKQPLIMVDFVLMTLLLIWLASPACPRPLRARAEPQAAPRPAA